MHRITRFSVGSVAFHSSQILGIDVNDKFSFSHDFFHEMLI